MKRNRLCTELSTVVMSVVVVITIKRVLAQTRSDMRCLVSALAVLRRCPLLGAQSRRGFNLVDRIGRTASASSRPARRPL